VNEGKASEIGKLMGKKMPKIKAALEASEKKGEESSAKER